MIYIKKEMEPITFREYCNSRNAKFDDMPHTCKDILREALMKEQKNICAYCMKRIPDNQGVKIEHYVARNDDNELLYNNLFACCYGNEGQPKALQTCDTRKGNDLLSINPIDRSHMESIIYKSDGTIASTDTRFNRDLNEILNLNCDKGYLKRNRKAALDSFMNQLKKVPDGKSAETFLNKIKEKYIQSNEYTEYIGIILFNVDKRLKRYQ